MTHTRLRTWYTSTMGEKNTAVCGAIVPTAGLTDDYTPTCPKCLDAIQAGGYRHRHDHPHIVTPATAPTQEST